MGVGCQVSGFRNNKGWLRIIEIALAATLVFSFMIFINTFEWGSSVSRPETDRYLLEQLGEDALRAFDLVDSTGNHVTDLRWEILTNDWNDIGDYLDLYLGENIAYSLYQKVANSTFQLKTGSTQKPINRDIASVSYIVAGDEARYCSNGAACLLKLELWFIQ